MSVKSIPDGYHTVTPYLTIKGANDAISFYQKAFGAEQTLLMSMPDGSVAHAEVKIGDSFVMLTEEQAEMGFKGPKTLGGASASLMIYCENVDEFYQNAIDSGCKEIRPVIDQFYGDRAGTLEDPFGHVWTIATHTEDLTPEELNTRMQEFLASMS